ncbi:MAG TPA: SMP-30/gluconolactonase/LRE family protein [Vicinamibacteria bacterium]
MRRFDESPFEIVASGLEYPEGPIACADGSVLLVEVKGGRLTRVHPDGTKATVATTGGSPNGAAFGPDGRVWLCNSGGFDWVAVGSLWITGFQPAAYQGGSIQRVDVSTGAVETVYTTFATADPVTKQPATLPLKGPDDLVFDATGGFWFTDWGKQRPRDRDVTGVYYVPSAGGTVREAIFPLNAPNGIALSPDGRRLYVAETYTRRILFWDLSGPGQITANPRTLDGSHLLTAAVPGQGILDSMRVDAEGNVWAATMLPSGADPGSNGGLTVVSPAGEVLQFLEIAVGTPTPLPSNLCFGGADRRTVYATCGGSGLLVKARVSVPGLALNFG